MRALVGKVTHSTTPSFRVMPFPALHCVTFFLCSLSLPVPLSLSSSGRRSSVLNGFVLFSGTSGNKTHTATHTHTHRSYCCFVSFHLLPVGELTNKLERSAAGASCLEVLAPASSQPANGYGTVYTSSGRISIRKRQAHRLQGLHASLEIVGARCSRAHLASPVWSSVGFRSYR